MADSFQKMLFVGQNYKFMCNILSMNSWASFDYSINYFACVCNTPSHTGQPYWIKLHETLQQTNNVNSS